MSQPPLHWYYKIVFTYAKSIRGSPMSRQRLIPKLLLCLVLLFTSQTVFMQDAAVAVPNIVGMNLPQAAATLNRAGLALGTQTNVGWTAESGLPQNTIQTQSYTPDQTVPPG